MKENKKLRLRDLTDDERTVIDAIRSGAENRKRLLDFWLFLDRSTAEEKQTAYDAAGVPEGRPRSADDLDALDREVAKWIAQHPELRTA